MSVTTDEKWVCPACKTPWEWHIAERRLCLKAPKPERKSGCYENPKDPRIKLETPLIERLASRLSLLHHSADPDCPGCDVCEVVDEYLESREEVSP